VEEEKEVVVVATPPQQIDISQMSREEVERLMEE